MSDIIDIVHRLSYQIDDEGIKRQLKTFNSLNKQVEQYEFALNQANKDDIANQKALQAELNRTKNARDNVGKSIIDNINNSKKTQEVIKGEIKSINDLTAKLESLKRARNAATSTDALNIYKKGIADTQAEINKLTGQGSTSFISQLFGAQQGVGLGKQIFQGAILGLGIGGGIGIISRLVSGLVEFGIAELDVAKKEKELVQANDEAAASFEGLGSAIEKFNSIVRDIELFNNVDPDTFIKKLNATEQDYQEALGKTTDGIKRKAEETKALGVINLKQYDADKRNLEADQKVRESEQKDLEKQKSTYSDILKLLKSAQDVSSVSNIKDKGARQQAAENIKNVLDTSPLFIPKDAKAKIKQQIDEATKNEVDYYDAIEKTKNQYQAKSVENDQKIADKRTEIITKQQEFDAKHRQQIDELNLHINIELRKQDEEYNIEKLKGYQETTTNIIRQIEAEKSAAKQAVEDEIFQAELKGTLTTEILQKYRQKQADIDRKFDLQQSQLINASLQKRILSDLSYRSQTIQGTLQSIGFTIGGETANADIASIDDYRKRAEQQNLLSKNELLKSQTEREIQAEKEGHDLVELHNSFEEEKLHNEKQAHINSLKAYEDYYDDLSKLIENSANRGLLNVRLNTTDAQASNSRNYLFGNISGKSLDYRNRLLGLAGQRTSDNENIDKLDKILQAQQAEKINLSLNGGSEEQLNKIEDKIKSTKISINELTNDIAKIQEEQKSLVIQHIEAEIQGYANLAEAALNAYQQINDAHAKYLDTEISIQTERVREAEVLAQRGNTAALTQQEEVLRKQEQQKELYARRQIEINSALAVSNALVAVAEAAAAGGGVISPALIAAVIAALGAGYAAVEALNSPSSQPGFAEGGFTGAGGKHEPAGIVHKGEFVVNAEKTRTFRPLLEAIHKNEFAPIAMVNNDRYKVDSSGISKTDISILAKKLDENTDAVRESKVHAEQRIDRHGVAQIITQQVRSDRRRWG